MQRTLVYYCPASDGGIADYAQAQVAALASCEVDVVLLVPPNFRRPDRVRVQLVENLQTKSQEAAQSRSRLRRQLATAQTILKNIKVLEQTIKKSGVRHVLLAAYAEYLAPLWAGRLRRLAKQGVFFGAVVHDPVRHAEVGPRWWHSWSVAAGYSFLQEAFVHEPVELDTVKPQPQLCTTVIPHGMYTVAPPRKSADQMRAELNLPAGAKVLLSFGHIKDYKNLDLAIRALVQLPDIFLVVAGSESPGRDRPAQYYQKLARQLQVAERCRWRVRHVPENEIGNYFEMADLVLLTYRRAFRSASGVLNLAVAYRKPCLASAGASNLETVVKKYGLGVWLEPDSEAALIAGLHQCLLQPPKIDWGAYEQENSWEQNAKIVSLQMFRERAAGMSWRR